MMLTRRQEQILCRVVDAYLRDGEPVASRTIAADAELHCSPSTVRNELAMLEERGLLQHPHTSAGRMPTDAGQRYVVDMRLAAGGGTRHGRLPAHRLELSLAQQEIEQAMRVTTQALSRACDLLAVVSAPSPSAATIRHIEVLALQPETLMVVVITSNGGVSKLMATYPRPVDPGLIAWAGEYLNERLRGLALGARMIGRRLEDPAIGPAERALLERLAPALADIASSEEERLYVDGTARLVSESRVHEIDHVNELMELLERRVALLGLLRSALSQPGVFVRIGSENPVPAMRSLGVVASGYGLAARPLGTVSVIGPSAMDYPGVIAAVRDAARELSRYVQDAYR